VLEAAEVDVEINGFIVGIGEGAVDGASVVGLLLGFMVGAYDGDPVGETVGM